MCANCELEQLLTCHTTSVVSHIPLLTTSGAPVRWTIPVQRQPPPTWPPKACAPTPDSITSHPTITGPAPVSASPQSIRVDGHWWVPRLRPGAIHERLDMREKLETPDSGVITTPSTPIPCCHCKPRGGPWHRQQQRARVSTSTSGLDIWRKLTPPRGSIAWHQTSEARGVPSGCRNFPLLHIVLDRPVMRAVFSNGHPAGLG
jgi:hypothetical protein